MNWPCMASVWKEQQAGKEEKGGVKKHTIDRESGREDMKREEGGGLEKKERERERERENAERIQNADVLSMMYRIHRRTPESKQGSAQTEISINIAPPVSSPRSGM